MEIRDTFFVVADRAVDRQPVPEEVQGVLGTRLDVDIALRVDRHIDVGDVAVVSSGGLLRHAAVADVQLLRGDHGLGTRRQAAHEIEVGHAVRILHPVEQLSVGNRLIYVLDPAVRQCFRCHRIDPDLLEVAVLVADGDDGSCRCSDDGRLHDARDRDVLVILHVRDGVDAVLISFELLAVGLDREGGGLDIAFLQGQGELIGFALHDRGIKALHRRNGKAGDLRQGHSVLEDRILRDDVLDGDRLGRPDALDGVDAVFVRGQCSAVGLDGKVDAFLVPVSDLDSEFEFLAGEDRRGVALFCLHGITGALLQRHIIDVLYALDGDRLMGGDILDGIDAVLVCLERLAVGFDREAVVLRVTFRDLHGELVFLRLLDRGRAALFRLDGVAHRVLRKVDVPVEDGVGGHDVLGGDFLILLDVLDQIDAVLVRGQLLAVGEDLEVLALLVAVQDVHSNAEARLGTDRLLVAFRRRQFVSGAVHEGHIVGRLNAATLDGEMEGLDGADSAAGIRLHRHGRFPVHKFELGGGAGGAGVGAVDPDAALTRVGCRFEGEGRILQRLRRQHDFAGGAVPGETLYLHAGSGNGLHIVPARGPGIPAVAIYGVVPESRRIRVDDRRLCSQGDGVGLGILLAVVGLEHQGVGARLLRRVGIGRVCSSRFTVVHGDGISQGVSLRIGEDLAEVELISFACGHRRLGGSFHAFRQGRSLVVEVDHQEIGGFRIADIHGRLLVGAEDVEQDDVRVFVALPLRPGVAVIIGRVVEDRDRLGIALDPALVDDEGLRVALRQQFDLVAVIEIRQTVQFVPDLPLLHLVEVQSIRIL